MLPAIVSAGSALADAVSALATPAAVMVRRLGPLAPSWHVPPSALYVATERDPPSSSDAAANTGWLTQDKCTLDTIGGRVSDKVWIRRVTSSRRSRPYQGVTPLRSSVVVGDPMWRWTPPLPTGSSTA